MELHLPISIRRESIKVSSEKPFVGNFFSHTVLKHVPFLNMHAEIELGICTQGCVRRHWGAYHRDCRPGDIWFCGSWDPHGSSIIEAPTSYLVLIFSPSVLTTVNMAGVQNLRWLDPFTAPPQEQPTTADEIRDEVCDLANRMAWTMWCSKPGPWRVRLQVLELLSLVLDYAPEAQRSVEPTPPIHHSDIAPALELVLENQRYVTTEEAAEACTMSRNRFMSVFRDLMGITFANYALRHRFGNAARDLAETNLPIKAVATRWGFTDASHMHRVFKRFAGCSPLEYRRQLGRKSPSLHQTGVLHE